MTKADRIHGQCLCGAVTVSAIPGPDGLNACSCDMCRRHTGSVFISLQADPKTVTVDGPAKSFRSSEWAERGFCEVCGSTLWYGTVHDGARYLSAGLFDNAGGQKIALEFFADQTPDGYRLEGDHKRLSAAETIALFADAEEGA